MVAHLCSRECLRQNYMRYPLINAEEELILSDDRKQHLFHFKQNFCLFSICLLRFIISIAKMYIQRRLFMLLFSSISAAVLFSRCFQSILFSP